MCIENTFTDMHLTSIAMEWCSQGARQHMALGLLKLAMREAVDAPECLLADVLAKHNEWKPGPGLTC
jgi:hypothetical protein